MVHPDVFSKQVVSPNVQGMVVSPNVQGVVVKAADVDKSFCSSLLETECLIPLTLPEWTTNSTTKVET